MACINKNKCKKSNKLKGFFEECFRGRTSDVKGYQTWLTSIKENERNREQEKVQEEKPVKI